MGPANSSWCGRTGPGDFKNFELCFAATLLLSMGVAACLKHTLWRIPFRLESASHFHLIACHVQLLNYYIEYIRVPPFFMLSSCLSLKRKQSPWSASTWWLSKMISNLTGTAWLTITREFGEDGHGALVRGSPAWQGWVVVLWSPVSRLQKDCNWTGPRLQKTGPAVLVFQIWD